MREWRFRANPPELAPRGWAEELSITPMLLDMLWRRGFRDRSAMDDYLSASLGRLTPPAAWPQIPHASAIIAKGLLGGKRLAVWGDYDVDGITATTIVLDVLEAHGFSPMYHLPDRRAEGYGLNAEGIEKLAASGCDMLLTVDCGICDNDAVARARELGMTVVVSDHHLPGPELPAADSIVNPRIAQAGDWPSQHLAGVGVAFYLMAAVNALLASHTGKRYKMDAALDLVALGTLADVMCLEGENRILVRGGLAHMAQNCRPGIAALKVIGGMDVAGAVSSGQALFRLVPRINAAGRMGDPALALKLLRAREYTVALPCAQELDERNRERKQEEKRIFQEASAQARDLCASRDYAALVLYGADWHPGVVGIVASRIVEVYNKPAIILCKDGASLKGSGRSVANFDLHAGLASVSCCLLGFGGHKQAAGVRLEENRLEEFRARFHDVCLRKLGEDPALPSLLLECELDFSHASNFEFLRELELMQPFGPGNSEPVFASPPLLVKKRAFLGHTQEHVILKVEDQKSGITLSAKAWRMANELPSSLVGQRIRLAYTPRVDSYNGMPSIDLGIKDWRPVGNSG